MRVWNSSPAVSSNAGEAKSGIGVDMMIKGQEVVMFIDVADFALRIRLNCLAEPAHGCKVDSHGPSALIFRIEIPERIAVYNGRRSETSR